MADRRGCTPDGVREHYAARVRRCRSCGAPILWAVTFAGKRMPIDAVECDGNIDLKRRGDGELVIEIVRADDVPKLRADNYPLYSSHFVTCPNAGSHRRPRT